MSETFIAILLVVPVIVVIFILFNSHKKQKKKALKKIHAYVEQLDFSEQFKTAFQKQLVHQRVLFDEPSRRLLVINHKDGIYSHDLIDLSEIKAMQVSTIRETFNMDKKQNPDTIVTRIGIELNPQKKGEAKFLTFYDHIEHSVFQISELQNEAAQFCAMMTNVNTGKLIQT